MLKMCNFSFLCKMLSVYTINNSRKGYPSELLNIFIIRSLNNQEDAFTPFSLLLQNAV